jgi:hypothetical protein
MSKLSSKGWEVGCAFHSLMLSIGAAKGPAPCSGCKIKDLVTFHSPYETEGGLPRQPTRFLNELYQASCRAKCIHRVRLRMLVDFSSIESEILQGLYTDGAHHKQEILTRLLRIIRSPEEIQILKDQYGDWED